MKNISFLFLLFVSSITGFAQYDHQNINFLGRFDDSTVVAEPVYGIRYQSCWGWTNPNTGREYGIIGSTAGTYIIEVTDPSSPALRDYIPHRQTDCIWHEYKTYQNYLYIISDDGGNNSLQIADLSTLPDSATVIYDSTNIFVHSHTLYIEGDKMYVASVSTTGGGFSSMNVYSLANPALPVLLRRLDADYPAIGSVHDMYVVNDTVYASCGYDGLFIFRYDDVQNQFIQLGSLTNFPTSRYNHSSFLSPDHRYLYMTDEVPAGMPVSVVDVSDIANPTVVYTFQTHAGDTPHNPYVKGNHLFLSAYMDGVYVYDITNPSTPVVEGYFDTYPANAPGSYPSPGYAGSWASYTDLPSGTLLVSDMQSGLFCLDVSTITGIRNSNEPLQFACYPDPATDFIHVNCSGNEKNIIEMTDLSGRVLLSTIANKNETVLNVSSLTAGMYLIKLTGKNNFSTKKVCITRY